MQNPALCSLCCGSNMVVLRGNVKRAPSQTWFVSKCCPPVRVWPDGMKQDSKIYVAGHRGLVGSAIWRELERQGFRNLVGRSHKELDLLDGAAVGAFYQQERPEYV